MTRGIRNYLTFLRRCARIAFVGDWRYYAWMGLLTTICLLGLNAYARQLAYGLSVTGMTDEVSWGVYIANFTFLVGVAAAAAMMVIPVYIYNNVEMHDLVIFGELLAVAAILMCLAFVTVDLGGPDRFWHLMPASAIQLSSLDAVLGRHRPERLPAAERVHLRVPALLRFKKRRRRSCFTSRSFSSRSSGR